MQHQELKQETMDNAIVPTNDRGMPEHSSIKSHCLC